MAERGESIPQYPYENAQFRVKSIQPDLPPFYFVRRGSLKTCLWSIEGNEPSQFGATSTITSHKSLFTGTSLCGDSDPRLPDRSALRRNRHRRRLVVCEDGPGSGANGQDRLQRLGKPDVWQAAIFCGFVRQDLRILVHGSSIEHISRGGCHCIPVATDWPARHIVTRPSPKKRSRVARYCQSSR